MPQYAASIDLATLNGTNGFRLDGIDAGDQSGRSVASAGDVNGDGFDDLIVGARYGDPGGDADAGETYVVFGKASGFAAALDLATLDGTNGFRLDGIDVGDFNGASVASAGDVNGDGFDDLIIGARFGDPGGDIDAGETYVVFGKASGFTAAIDLATLDGTIGFRLDGIDAGDYSGFSVASAGDVNGDGFDDLIIGSFGDAGGDSDAGESYVVFGKASGFTATLDLSTLDGSSGFRLDGIDPDDNSGCSVASGGDVNGDGFDDLVVGARFGDPGGNSDAGETYVVFGKASGFAATLDLTTLDGTTGFRIDGIGATEYSGYSVASAGDLNGDGFDDLIIGAWGADPGGDAFAGSSYVIFGKGGGFAASLDLATLNGLNGFRIDGIDANDFSGFCVASAGDVNGDGFDDLLIGARLGDPGGDSAAGESYVVFGKASGFAAALDLSTLDGNTGFRLDGIDASDQSGRSVASAGDVNGDGFDDLIVGAFGGDPGGDSNAGETYVVFGGKPGEAVVRTGTAIANRINGGDLADTLSGLGGNDTLIGHGGDDRLFGGAGDDLLAGGIGTDTADFSLAASAATVDLGAGTAIDGDGGDDTLVDLENIRGSGFADTLTGSAGSNRIDAGGGADVVNGGDGSDNLFGDGGDDTLNGGGGGDILYSDAGDDTFDGGADGDTVSFFNGLPGAVFVDLNIVGPQNTGSQGFDTFISIEAITGSNLFADNVIGDGGANAFRGFGGDDMLDGGGGADQLDGGFGFDTLLGAAGADTLVGLEDDDLLNGGAGDDLLDGGIGTDTASYFGAVSAVNVDLSIVGAQNTLGAGSDSLVQMEALAGSSFNDTLTGNASANVISGGAGGDAIDGGAGVDRLFGEAGDDYVYFDAGDDLANVLGGADFDTLIVASADRTTASAFDLAAHGFEQGRIDYVDTGAAFNWTNAYVFTLPGWAVNYQDTNYDDGSRQVRYNDFDASKPWSAYTDYYTAGGALEARQTVYESGRFENQFFDLPPNDPFSSYIDYITASVQLEARRSFFDDGSYQTVYFDLGGQAWSYYTDYTNPAGQLVARQTFNDDNSFTNTYFDPVPPNANPWAQYTDYFNAAGVFIGRAGVNDDGTLF